MTTTNFTASHLISIWDCYEDVRNAQWHPNKVQDRTIEYLACVSIAHEKTFYSYKLNPTISFNTGGNDNYVLVKTKVSSNIQNSLKVPPSDIYLISTSTANKKLIKRSLSQTNYCRVFSCRQLCHIDMIRLKKHILHIT